MELTLCFEERPGLLFGFVLGALFCSISLSMYNVVASLLAFVVRMINLPPELVE